MLWVFTGYREKPGFERKPCQITFRICDKYVRMLKSGKKQKKTYDYWCRVRALGILPGNEDVCNGETAKLAFDSALNLIDKLAKAHSVKFTDKKGTEVAITAKALQKLK